MDRASAVSVLRRLLLMEVMRLRRGVVPLMHLPLVRTIEIRGRSVEPLARRRRMMVRGRSRRTTI